jgi:tetratricopeptide (TPR) repeat protein
LGRTAEADSAVAEALRLQPDFYEAYMQLGYVRMHQGRFGEAGAALREAVRFQPDSCMAQYNLATFLASQGKLAEAVGPFREAVRLRPEPAYAFASCQLGDVLSKLGEWSQAADAYREALRRQPEFAQAHCDLGQALQQMGQFGPSRDEYRLGHALGSRLPNWPHPSAQWLRDAEWLLQLEPRLPAILQGTTRPRDGQESMGFAEVCARKRLYAVATRLYAEGLAGSPRWANDPRLGRRYNAACYALLAASGQGDGKELDLPERERLRQQARAWLEADLRAYRGLLEQEAGNGRAAAAQKMSHWQRDPDLASVREQKAVNLLSPSDRLHWGRLWEQVEALRRQAMTPKGK